MGGLLEALVKSDNLAIAILAAGYPAIGVVVYRLWKQMLNEREQERADRLQHMSRLTEAIGELRLIIAQCGFRRSE